MSLTELLEALKDNTMLEIEITETVDDGEATIIGFEAPGYPERPTKNGASFNSSRQNPVDFFTKLSKEPLLSQIEKHPALIR